MTSYAITGSSRGIGLEWINQLSAASPANQVFALVRNPTSSQALLDLAAARPNVTIIKADVTSRTELPAAAAVVAAKTGGKLDVLVYNAVAYPSSPDTAPLGPSGFAPDNDKLVETLKSEFDLMWDTAVYGTLWTLNSFVPLLEAAAKEKGESVAVCVSTGLADADFILNTGVPFLVPYSVAKGAMNTLATKYAVDLKPKGIKVITVSPGWVDTWPGPGEKPAPMVESDKVMLKYFQRVDPTLKGPITTEESVLAQRKLLEKIDDSIIGKMVSQHGNDNWF